MIKSIKAKTAIIAVAMAVPAIMLGTSASAIGEGQIERGDFYYSKNLTSGGSFGDPTGANKCEQLQYKVRMHNPGASPVTNVRINVSLPSAQASQNVSTATITADNAFPVTVSDTATVNISSQQTITYKSGSTELLNASNQVISTLPDGITTSAGVNIGTVGVSINEIRFVQFRADISCPEPPKPEAAYKCESLSITADKNRTVKITGFTTSATNGAVFKNAVITWGDNSANLTTADVVDQTHQYAADGTYTITAVAHFTIDGKGDVTAGGSQCQQTVKFSSTKPPVVTPPTVVPPTTATPTPGKLADTGPGSTAAIFAATTAIGAYLHRRFTSRRLASLED